MLCLSRMLLSCDRVSSDHLTDKLRHILSDLCHYFRMPDQHSLSECGDTLRGFSGIASGNSLRGIVY